MDLPAELSSVVSSLEEMTRRVTTMAEQADNSEAAAELFAVERALLGALRRLSRLTG